MDRSQLDAVSPFLANLPERGIEAFCAMSRLEHFAPGAVLFSEGAPHPDFHLMLAGHVRLDMNVPPRGRMPLLTVGPGDILAWSALVSRGVMTTSAVALDAVQTAAIDGVQLRRLCDEQPETGYVLMRELAAALSRRLVATRLQLLDLFASHEPATSSRPAGEHPKTSRGGLHEGND